MVYIFSNFNDFIESFEEETVTFTTQRYPLEGMKALVRDTNQYIYFVGPEVLFERYKDILPEGTERINISDVGRTGIFLILRRKQNKIHRIMANATVRRNRDKITEILDYRKKHGGR